MWSGYVEWVCRGVHGGVCREGIQRGMQRGYVEGYAEVVHGELPGDNRKLGSLRHILRGYIHYELLIVSEH